MEKEKSQCLLIFQMQCIGFTRRPLTEKELAQIEKTFNLVWEGGVVEGKETMLSIIQPRMESIADKTADLVGQSRCTN